jgi:hypothetical protein
LQAQSGPVGGEGSTFVPAAAGNLPPPAIVGVGVGVGTKKGGGRAELPDAMIGKGVGAGGIGGEMEKEKGNVISEISPVSPERGEVEMDAQGQGRYGLRPEELDGEGRYVGELHGDGRQFGGGGGGVELEGSGVLR